MGKIICMMGKSSTGKDTIYNRILENAQLNLTPLVTYTTRPIRAGEIEGKEYHFTDEAGYKKLLEQGRIVEERSYNTVHGIWRYFTVAQDLEEATNYIMIGTLQAYEAIKKYYGAEVLLPIYIEIDDGERLQRALNREKKQEKPKYEELCRRFLADSEDFSEENIKKAGIQKRFANENLEDCVNTICTYIQDNVK